MFYKTSNFLFLFFCIPLWGFSQTLKNEEFNELYFNESFDNNRRGWLNLNSQDNFFIIKDGFYELQRRNEKSSDIVLCPFTSKVNVFQLSAHFTLSTAAAYPTFAGIIFSATKDGTQAIAFEVSTQREFRIRKLNGTNWLYLTSGGTVQGWQKTNSIPPSGSEFELLVQTKNEEYDFYINGNFVVAKTISGAHEGDFGFSLGPSSKVKADELTIMTTLETMTTGSIKEKPTENLRNDITQKNMSEKEKQRYANQSDRITELEKELEQIKKIAESLEQENRVLKNQDENARVNELNKTILQLQTELNKSFQTIDNLKAADNPVRVLNPDRVTDSVGNKPLDQYIYQKYTTLVKENIALKSELEDAKNNQGNTSGNFESSVNNNKSTYSELVSLKEKIKVLEDQLRLSHEFNLKLVKDKNQNRKMESQTSSTGGDFHVVLKGETLFAISKKYANLTVKELMLLNGLVDNNISVGQKLTIR